MSSTTGSPPSLMSTDIDSKDSFDSLTPGLKIEEDYSRSSSLQSNTVSNNITSHNVNDILSDGNNFGEQDSTFPDCKTDVLSGIPPSFVQDYNSRDSTAFSIQDILGLPQSYSPGNNQDVSVEKYDYQITSYETINNSSNYVNRIQNVSTKSSLNKTDQSFDNTKIPTSDQLAYNNYSGSNSNIFQQKNIFGINGTNFGNSTRQIGDIQQASFSNQVCTNIPKLYFWFSKWRNDKTKPKSL